MPEEARSFAVAAHGGQRYGDLPYSFHLDEVAALLAPYGSQAQIIGYLHYVIEDTAVTESDIRDRFGPLIADCVSLLTDPSGSSRAERKAATYARLATVNGPTEVALLVKAADRLANVRSCVRGDRRGLMTVYRNEHASFRRSAYRAGLCDPLWRELDTLLAATHVAADHP